MQFQKISIPTPRRWSLEIPKGEGGGEVISITQVFKRKCEAILEIPGGRRVQSKEPSLGEVWILFGTTHFNNTAIKLLKTLKPVLQKNLILNLE